MYRNDYTHLIGLDETKALTLKMNNIGGGFAFWGEFPRTCQDSYKYYDESYEITGDKKKCFIIGEWISEEKMEKIKNIYDNHFNDGGVISSKVLNYLQGFNKSVTQSLEILDKIESTILFLEEILET